ncbi:MAG: hypothetical protein EOM53_01960 [Alphaproteobacteria bacterium]|nr:hypothetical protein [Alphaproteobacteria bacterium]
MDSCIKREATKKKMLTVKLIDGDEGIHADLIIAKFCALPSVLFQNKKILNNQKNIQLKNIEIQTY